MSSAIIWNPKKQTQQMTATTAQNSDLFHSRLHSWNLWGKIVVITIQDDEAKS
jgi:hypothetical protein